MAFVFRLLGNPVHDAAYVALAQRMSLPLITADETLARRLVGDGLDVRFLADWP